MYDNCMIFEFFTNNFENPPKKGQKTVDKLKIALENWVDILQKPEILAPLIKIC
jgi:hypothetical protein